MRRPLILSLAAVLSLASCRTAERVTRVALSATPEGRLLLPAFNRYAKVAHILRRYHDSGRLDEAGAIAILVGAGVSVARGPHVTRTGGTGPAPFPVPKYRGGYRWPLEAGVVSSEFGRRWNRPHDGIDIAADLGVPVHAAAPGQVLYAGDQVRGYGNLIILRHDQKTTTFYGHNSALKVKTGDHVDANEVIALLGSTGRSTGPHVHFEYREGDKPINPRLKLPKPDY